jgi:hypothetical protein
VNPKRKRRLSQQDLRLLGVRPGLIVARYSPDGTRARVEQLTSEAGRNEGDLLDTIRERSAEVAENQIDTFISRRDRERRKTEGDRRAEEMWAESVARFHERSEAEMRERWVEYHRHLQILHQGLADEHEAEAEKLENGHTRGEELR